MAVKTCIQQKYAIYDFQYRMYPQRGQQFNFGDEHKIFVEQFT